MQICVVINTYHRSLDLVERSIRAALQQSISPDSVLLIDQNQPSLKLSMELMANPKLKIQTVDAGSVSLARNLAQIPSSIEWVIFCDDDGYMDSQYIATLQRLLRDHPDLSIFAGSIKRDDNHDFYSPRHRMGGSLQYFKNTKLLMGSNFVIRRNIFDQLGRFDTAFGAGAYWGSGEETDFCWKAFFAKIKMEFFPELVVFHIKPYAGSFSHSLKKAFQYGRGKGALVFKWLFLQRKLVVILEAIEMLLVPMFQFLFSLITLRAPAAFIYLVVFCSRIYGFFEAIFVFIRN